MFRKFLLFLTVFNFFSVACFAEAPKISIITSMYKGEKFIEHFLADIVKQTIFDQCELLIINANSPENEEPIIRKYMEQYPNIFYQRLEEDPGLYGVWNIGIEHARGEFITNANVDDRLAHNCYEVHLQALEENPDIDLVYSAYLVTKRPNEVFVNNSAYIEVERQPFASDQMWECLPGCNPMWRKSMNEKYGLFDESYVSSGDWEMWCRAVKLGAKFLKVPGCYCLYYYNPTGLSTYVPRFKLIGKERTKITILYGSMWGYKWPKNSPWPIQRVVKR